MAAKAVLGGVVAPADKGIVIRIGDKETARRRNTEKYKWVRIIMISDTHNKHDKIGSVPDGDILLHCGDATMSGKASKVRAFGKWMASLPHKYKLFVPGNHDYTLDPNYYGEKGLWNTFHSEPRFPSLAAADACLPGVHILRDAGVEVHGLKIHGFPHIPEPHGRKMAFCHDLHTEGKPTPTMRAPLSRIPADTDLLAVHGPAYTFLDQIAYGGRSVGSASLRDWVLAHRPALVACGHIHEARGALRDSESGVTFVNAACLTHRYKEITDAATVVDIGIPVASAPAAAAADALPDAGGDAKALPGHAEHGPPSDGLPIATSHSLEEALPGPGAPAATAGAARGADSGAAGGAGGASKAHAAPAARRKNITDGSYTLLHHRPSCPASDE